MKKAFALLVLTIVLILSSCTTERNVFSASDKRTDLINALSVSTSERDMSEILESAPAIRGKTAAKSEAEPAVEVEKAEDIAIEEALEQSEQEEVQTETEFSIEPEENVVELSDIVAEAEEKAIVEAEEAEKNDIDADGSNIISESEAIERTDGIVSETQADKATVANSQSEDSKLNSVNEILTRFMVISVVIVVLFTVATAIRNGFKTPIDKGLSIVFAVLLSVIPLVISIAVGGWFYEWLLYLILLGSYPIFRSGGKRR